MLQVPFVQVLPVNASQTCWDLGLIIVDTKKRTQDTYNRRTCCMPSGNPSILLDLGSQTYR